MGCISICHIHRLIWHKIHSVFLAVAKCSKNCGKSDIGVTPSLVAANSITSSFLKDRHYSSRFQLRLIILALAITSNAVTEVLLPTGGNVVSGAGTISEAGNTMTIIQTTTKMAANWQTFNIGAGNSVNFVQPSASAIALNRVLGTDVSVIQGNLTATGQVFLINPNGVLFSPTAQVSAGGLVASTLELSTADFMAGNYQFGGTSSNAITNQGNIASINGGSIALIAAKITNTGSLTANVGDVLLGAGSEVLLDLGGPVKLQVTRAAIGALIQNGGAMKADGGLVYLTAQAAGNLAATVINNTGVIEAHTLAAGDIGQIMLMGGMANSRILVGGILDASAPSGGSGGFIETSAAHVKLADGVKITTVAPRGLTGSWLVDPVDFTIAATGGDITGIAMGTLLANNSITIETSTSATATSTNLVGTTGTNGDIFVNDTISWSAENSLTLNAWGNININQSITSTGAAGKLTLLYGQGALTAGNTGVYNIKAPVNLAAGANLSTRLGSDGALKNYIVITELGAQDSITGTDLQGINGGLAFNYALGSNINAAVTSTWDAGAGFKPIGSIATPFSAGFDGLGHTITGLTINRPAMASVGLFGQNGPGTAIGNVGLVAGTVIGGAGTGGLVGANTLGSVNNSYNTGTVVGGAGTGGLVGSSTTGNISNSYTTGAVAGGAGTGGLVGSSTTGNISNSYTTGTVTGAAGTGGLVGASTTGNISNSYTTGTVVGAAGTGGLVGAGTTGDISNNYTTGTVAGGAGTGGLVGNITTGAVINNYTTGDVAGGAGTGGLIGSTTGLISFSSAAGNVTGTAGTGGLVGVTTGHMTQNYASGHVTGGAGTGGLAGTTTGNIDNSYATGNVTATTGGGLVGTTTGTIIKSHAAGTATIGSAIAGIRGTGTVDDNTTFWDNNKNPRTAIANSGTGITSVEMATPGTIFTDAGWDNAIWDFSGSWPILKALIRSVTVDINANDVSKVYDSLVYTSPYTATFSDATASYTGTLSYGGAGITATNVGSYAITPFGLTPTSAQYVFIYVDGNLTITPKALAITGMSAANKIYDGGAVAVLTGGLLDTGIAGETLTFAGHTGLFADMNAANGIAVTVTGTTLEDDTGLASNYSLTQTTGLTANITTVPVTENQTPQIGGITQNLRLISANIITSNPHLTVMLSNFDYQSPVSEDNLESSENNNGAGLTYVFLKESYLNSESDGCTSSNTTNDYRGARGTAATGTIFIVDCGIRLAKTGRNRNANVEYDHANE